MIHRGHWAIIRDFVLGWMIALAFLLLIRNYGTLTPSVPAITWIESVILVIGFGLLNGITFGLAQILFEQHTSRRRPIWKIITAMIVIQSGIIIPVSFLVYHVYTVLFWLEPIGFHEFVRAPSYRLFFGYVILVNFVLSTLRQINLLLGSGQLRKLIAGRFHQPHVEARIFMFLDLKSSTSIAEQLGHMRYSQLLQDCFSDLAVVTHYRAEVYQYVGDEVVLTWRTADGLRDENCLRAFFAFEQALHARAGYYQREYGRLPTFKAGVHIGEVTVAEVGVIKREIAYHGDTINTAARIQDRASELGKKLLISESLAQKLPNAEDFVMRRVCNLALRGKSRTIDLYDVVGYHTAYPTIARDKRPAGRSVA